VYVMWQLMIGVWHCLAMDTSVIFLWFQDSTFYASCHNIMISFCQDVLSHACNIWISGNTYDSISAWLNLLTLQSRQHLSHLYLTNVFKNKVSWVFLMNSISLWRPTWTITDYSFFNTYHHLKISSSVIVFAGNVICRNINIFTFTLYTLDST
jgi:hypothetical protein